MFLVSRFCLSRSPVERSPDFMDWLDRGRLPSKSIRSQMLVFFAIWVLWVKELWLLYLFWRWGRILLVLKIFQWLILLFQPPEQEDCPILFTVRGIWQRGLEFPGRQPERL